MTTAPTGATAIAALEARRNEEWVLAEGAILGERRAAYARLAMIAMFGVLTRSQASERQWPGLVVGTLYTVFAVITIVVPARSAGRARARRWSGRSCWRSSTSRRSRCSR